MKLYVIVDAFLDKSHQTAQSNHATAEFCLRCPELARKWDNHTIIIKKAKNLEEWALQADACFREPYWDNKITAVAAFREDGYAKELPLV